MLIPHRRLSPEALRAVIEDFVTREGTDYGDTETCLAEKVRQVRAKLEAGEAVIAYDPESGSLSLEPTPPPE